jgi:chromatin remodeling complex protein RSC6
MSCFNKLAILQISERVNSSKSNNKAQVELHSLLMKVLEVVKTFKIAVGQQLTLAKTKSSYPILNLHLSN